MRPPGTDAPDAGYGEVGRTPVAVVGGGRMGTGIAHGLLLAGAEVRLIEASEDAAAVAADGVRELVRKTEARGKLARPPA